MKNLTKKQKIIISISIMSVAIIVLGIAIFGLIKTINKQKTAETAMIQEETENLQEQQNVVDNSEANIEDLVDEEQQKNQAENTTKQEKNNSSTSSSGYKYYIKVNYGANTVTIYTKDSNGKYTVPYKAMVCSTGTATPTSGVYTIKGRWRWLGLIGGVYGQYSTQIVGNILFHSVPYLDKSQDSLEYWEYDKLRNILFCWLY